MYKVSLESFWPKEWTNLGNIQENCHEKNKNISIYVMTENNIDMLLFIFIFIKFLWVASRQTALTEHGFQCWEKERKKVDKHGENSRQKGPTGVQT